MAATETAAGNDSSQVPDRRWPWRWIGLAAGVAAGLFDFAFMWWLDADMIVAGRDATFLISGGFVLTYGAIGLLVGRLMEARLRARADARTIERQLRELERAQRAVVQQEKLAALGRLAAGVAHEVRNPLGVIRASASMVRESFDPGEDPHRACDFICEEIDRLNSLISGLLSFARPTKLELAVTSIEKLIDRALHLVSDETRKRRITLERSGDASAFELHADPDLLSQVVYDLLLNAAEAVEADGRIALRVEADPDVLRVEVADDGPGVDPSVADQVFEPFVTTKASGTGLGLAMAQRIVETHGGALACLPGRGLGPGGSGACFRIELPRGGRVENAQLGSASVAGVRAKERDA
jgi:two-component system sensor histidine kinase HydH